MFVRGPSNDPTAPSVNVSVEYAVSAERGLDVLITPIVEVGVNLSDYAVGFSGTFAWARVGSATRTLAGLNLTGLNLPTVALTCTAPALELATLSGIMYASALDAGAVGLTTHTTSAAHDSKKAIAHSARIADIEDRVGAAEIRQRKHEARFGGEDTAELVEALTAALAWRHVYVPAEDGPILPMTYGFSWITPINPVLPSRDDWKYVLFCWDNLFASYTAAVLGYRDAAFSNFIQIVKSKANDGFVPNWAAGGSKSETAEPAVGGRVLLEMWKRFREQWIVELLFDDLFDWNKWQWDRRRTVSALACCTEPGFVTIGDDYQSCGTQSGNCPGGGESGLDQSPLWDCPGAAADGSGGNCSVFTTKTGLGPNPDHVLQIGDAQSTSLFVHDAESLAELADVLNRSEDASLLRLRASSMRLQLSKLWDPSQRFFADVFVQSGAFSSKLTPTALYPLLGRAASAEQAAHSMAHLMNRSELCVSADWARSNDARCYWGLPSVSASDPSYMQPPGYIYWRGNTWGPMTILVYWSVAEFAAAEPQNRSIVAPALVALAAQKKAQMMFHWRLHRHICENYSPYDPASATPPGDSQTNSECTGWQFYNWGALNGVPALLEIERLASSLSSDDFTASRARSSLSGEQTW